MGESEKRKHRCCITGHRPEKLKMSEETVCAYLSEAIAEAIRDGYTTIISGMARGVDIWAAEIVLAYREKNPAIHLICAIPHPRFEEKWKTEWQVRYKAILNKADLVKTICPVYSKGSYQNRNEWMVDHSSRIIAVYNGSSGGTKNTLSYAEKRGILRDNIKLL